MATIKKSDRPSKLSDRNYSPFNKVSKIENIRILADIEKESKILDFYLKETNKRNMPITREILLELMDRLANQQQNIFKVIAIK